MKPEDLVLYHIADENMPHIELTLEPGTVVYLKMPSNGATPVLAGTYSPDTDWRSRALKAETELKEWKLKAQCNEGMADCMHMVHQELIEAGVIDEKLAPMFVSNAVIARFRALEAICGAYETYKKVPE